MSSGPRRVHAHAVALGLAFALLMAACSGSGDSASSAATPVVTVVAEGLLNPIGLAAHPNGSVLIAEEGSGEDDDSAGVSVLTPDGRLGRLVTGLRSGRDAGDLAGVPLVGVSPDGSTGYVAHFGASSLLTFPIPASGPEPETKAHPAFTPDDLVPAMVAVNRVELVNPFDMTFDADGRPVVTDASGNGVAVETPEGTALFFHRFGELVDPAAEERKIDAVPTGIARVGDEFYVTLTGGCPFPRGAGQLVAVDKQRNERVVAGGLNMPIDVAHAADGTIWLLEFAEFDAGASCFTGEGYRAGTGRLSRVNSDGEIEEVLAGLDFPGAVLAMPDGSLYISEVFSGRILHLTWPEAVSIAPLAEPEGPWHFSDVAAAVGIDFVHGAFRTSVSADPAAMMGAGLCWIDIDGDGWLDLYLVNSHAVAEQSYWQGQGGLPRNRMYRNSGGTFEDVSETSGADLVMRGNGCVAADFDGDGDTDLYVTADGPNALLVNNGKGTFSEAGVDAGVAAPEWSTAAVVGDLNADGRPDLFVASYIDLERTIDKPSGAFPQDYLGLVDRLYLNIGGLGTELRFREVTLEAGLVRSDRALGALLTDVDLDGDLDLYVANDGNPNRLYRNDSIPGSDQLRFTDVTEDAGVGDSGSGMGVAGGDFDMDGTFDLLVTNWEAELDAIYGNQTSGTGIRFDYMTHKIGLTGLGNNKTGWGVTWADFDLDTDLDLLIVHGRVPIADLSADAELVRLYGNATAEGRKGQFRDWTTIVGLDAVGPVMARGSAAADFDNDGDVDVAVNVVGGHALLLRNDDPQGHWMGVTLSGFHPGAVVIVTLDDGTRMVREWHAGSSYLAGEDPRFRFGLGEATEVALLEVRWPDGTVTTRSGLAVDRSHTFDR